MGVYRNPTPLQPRTVFVAAQGLNVQSLTLSVGGSVTGAGLVVKQGQTFKGGVSTVVGSVINAASRFFSGSSGAAGSGQAAVVSPRGGSVTGEGSVVKQGQRTAAGSVTGAGAIAWLLTVRFAVGGQISAAGAYVASVLKPAGGTVPGSGIFTVAIARLFGGSLAAAGAPVKATTTTRTGDVTVTGFETGSLTLNRSMSGSSAAAGAASRQPQKIADGSSEASGKVRNFAFKRIGGSSTLQGIIAKVALARTFLGSLTPTSVLIKFATHALGGQVTGSGEATPLYVSILTLSGDLTATAHRLFASQKNLPAEIGLAGFVTSAFARVVSGQTQPQGKANELAVKTLVGQLAATGAVVTMLSLYKFLTAAISAVGGMQKAVGRPAAGAVTAVGSQQSAVSKPAAGSSSATGSIAKAAVRSEAASIGLIGSIQNAIAKRLAGSSQAAGAVSTRTSLFLNLLASILPAGNVVKAGTKTTTGAAAASGTAQRLTARSEQASITLSGQLATVRTRFLFVSGNITLAAGILRDSFKNLSSSVELAGRKQSFIVRSLAGFITAVGNAITTLLRAKADIEIYEFPSTSLEVSDFSS